MDAPTAPTTGAAIVGLLVRFFFIRAMSISKVSGTAAWTRHRYNSYPDSRGRARRRGLLPLWQPEFRMALNGALPQTRCHRTATKFAGLSWPGVTSQDLRGLVRAPCRCKCTGPVVTQEVRVWWRGAFCARQSGDSNG